MIKLHQVAKRGLFSCLICRISSSFLQAFLSLTSIATNKEVPFQTSLSLSGMGQLACFIVLHKRVVVG